MKANELMVGDLVYSTFCVKPCKVVGIEQYESEYAVVKVTNVSGAKDIHSLTPIPLTPEILEKNGFYYDEDRKAYLMGVIFRVKPERYGLFSFEICGCPYPLNTVHELQHALRLCEIEKEIVL